jgi:hypothetical protein
MTCAVPALGSAIQPVESLSRFSSCLGIGRWRLRRGTWAPGSGSCTPSMTSLVSSQTLRRAEEVTADETLQAHPGRSEFEFGRAKQHATFSRP